MTQENHAKLEALSPEGKNAYVTAKKQILDVLREMNLLDGVSISEQERATVYELLDETAFLMKSEENS